VAIEHHPATLKDVLLESRILEHTPLEQQAQLSRFCSLSEHSILNTLRGVAEGMKFLENKNVRTTTKGLKFTLLIILCI